MFPKSAHVGRAARVVVAIRTSESLFLVSVVPESFP